MSTERADVSTIPAAAADVEEQAALEVAPAGTRVPPPAAALAGLVAAAGFALPLVLGSSSLRFVSDAMIAGIFALSLGFLAGHVGLVSLAHGAFYGGAGYAMAIALSNDLGANAAVALALLVALALSLLVGAVSIRVPGIGFAIVTLAFGQVAYLIVTLNNLRSWFGGFDGRPVSVDSFLGIDNVSGPGLWPLIWAVAVVSVVGLWFLRRSPYGVLLSAIKDNEERARFSGFGTFVPRLAAFVLTGLIAGSAGVLAALNTSYVSPPNIFWVATAFALIAALIGGTGSLIGPFVGAFLIQFVQNRFATEGGVNLYLGILFIVVFVFAPSGLTGVAARWAARLRAGRRA